MGVPLGKKNPMEAPHHAEMDAAGLSQVKTAFDLAVTAAGACP